MNVVKIFLLLCTWLCFSVGRLSKLLIQELLGLVRFRNLSASINAAINLGFYGNFRIFLSEINPVEYVALPDGTMRVPLRERCTQGPQGLQLSVRRIRKFRLHLSALARTKWFSSCRYNNGRKCRKRNTSQGSNLVILRTDTVIISISIRNIDNQTLHAINICNWISYISCRILILICFFIVIKLIVHRKYILKSKIFVYNIKNMIFYYLLCVSENGIQYFFNKCIKMKQSNIVA